MEALSTIIFISILMWYIIDRAKPLWAALKHGKYITVAVSAVFAFALAFGYHLDFVAAMNIASPSTIGIVLTALVFMGGSSGLSELIKKLKI